MPVDAYQVSLQNACPESVYVSVTRNGTTVHGHEVKRWRATPATIESVETMMFRAKQDAERWIADDRTARRLEKALNAELQEESRLQEKPRGDG